MENNLTLPILCSYLPWKVNVLNTTNDRRYVLSFDNIEPVWLRANDGEAYNKLLLRPMSDLTKEIEHNGEWFVPMKMLVDSKKTDWDEMEVIEFNPFPRRGPGPIWYKVVHSQFDEVLSINPSNCLVLPFYMNQKLLEWKFDIYGGIGTWALNLNEYNGK